MFEVEAPFSLDTKYSDDTLSLLQNVTLGANGARYKHIGIPERIECLNNPLFLNLKLRNRLLANVTFCKRGRDWYVRYFAFETNFQASNFAGKSNRKGKLKRLLNDFFSNALKEPEGPDQFYAYIDPKNERSLWMSESFGFTTAAQIATQTFSRINPKAYSVNKLTDTNKIQSLVNQYFSRRSFYHPFQTFNSTPFYSLTKNNEIVAFAKVHYANWRIERLPGINGRFLTKAIPHVPLINKLIQPENHQFLALDTVWARDNNQKFVAELFEGILSHENHRVIHWWVDYKDPLYQSIKDKIKWGLINRINGVHKVNLVIRSKNKISLNEPFYVSGFDFI